MLLMVANEGSCTKDGSSTEAPTTTSLSDEPASDPAEADGEESPSDEQALNTEADAADADPSNMVLAIDPTECEPRFVEYDRSRWRVEYEVLGIRDGDCVFRHYPIVTDPLCATGIPEMGKRQECRIPPTSTPLEFVSTYHLTSQADPPKIAEPPEQRGDAELECEPIWGLQLVLNSVSSRGEEVSEGNVRQMTRDWLDRYHDEFFECLPSRSEMRLKLELTPKGQLKEVRAHQKLQEGPHLSAGSPEWKLREEVAQCLETAGGEWRFEAAIADPVRMKVEVH